MSGKWLLPNEKTGNPGGLASEKTRTKVGPTMDVGLVDYEGKSRLRKSRSGKITIDPCARESVCPIDMVPDEPLHKTAKNGTRYRAAGGESLINKGKERIKFRSGSTLEKMNFQAIGEVNKPLVSAAKIANKG